jgi:peptidoglycan/LPS O-acetylase OafA/YrhL
MHLNWRDELVLIAFAATVLLAAAAEMNGRSSTLQNQSFVHLGDASYALYMIHMPIKVGIFAITARYFGTALGPMWTAAILSYAVSILFALLTFRHFEMPAKTILLKFGNRYLLRQSQDRSLKNSM